MPVIEKNRVFDKTAIEGLKEKITELLKTAEEVTENLKDEMDNITGIAAGIPAEVKYDGLTTAASALKGSLDAQVYTDMQNAIEEKLGDLTAEIPLYDSRSAEVLTGLSTVAASLTGMLGELKDLIAQGSLTMSLEEFTGKLEEYEKRWSEGGSNLDAKMQRAMTYLKGLVLFSEFSMDPVNLSTGNFYYEKEDITVRGRLPLVFKRHYNALDKGGGALGEGWSHSLEARIGIVNEEEGNYIKKIILYLEDGRETAFVRDDAASCFRDIYTGSEEIEKTDEGYLYKKGMLSYAFDDDGHLMSMTDEDGNAIACSYDEEGRLTLAEQRMSGAGETEEHASFTFRYREDGSLKELTDHTGRSVSFFIMEGRLSEVTDPEGNTVCYRYGENGKIRAVRNAKGIMTVRNEYDEKGRITKQKFPDRGYMCYDYDDKKNRTVLTERNGSRITYVQDEKLRNVEIIYHDSSESCTYNDRNLRTSRTDRNGNTTRYSYDDKGKVTGIINALGEKTSLTYNGDEKLLCIKRCGREILRNSYDKEGRLIKSSDALGREQVVK